MTEAPPAVSVGRVSDARGSGLRGSSLRTELGTAGADWSEVLTLPRADAPQPKHADPLKLPTPDTTHFEFGVPSPLPQELACGERSLVRLLPQGFVSYQLSTLERKVISTTERFYSATALLGYSSLLVGTQSTQRYYAGERSAEPFARTAALGPFSVFADNDAKDQYWVHYLRDPALYTFHLGLTEFDPLRLRQLALPGADGRVVYRMPSGAVLYTSALTRYSDEVESFAEKARSVQVAWLLGSQQRVYAVGDLAPQLVGVAASQRTDRFWAFDLECGASLIEMARGRPVPRRYAFDGKLVNFDVEADRVLALTTSVNTSHLYKGSGGGVRSFQLELWEHGARRFSEVVNASAGGVGGWFERNLPNHDVCVFPGRTWIALGGRGALTIWDYATRRVVLEDVN